VGEPQRDHQTVTADGAQLGRLPDGTVLRDLVTHVDERGTVCELYDLRWGANPDPLVFAYLFTIRPGHAKGWGLHRAHEDRYAFLSGELELALYDAREDSPTAGLESRLFLTTFARRLVTIPRGVWHAERNIGDVDVQVVNFPTIPYDHADPDKYRLPLDTDELPVVLGAGWNGW
jgi:dTDP-4-dehydrorhamnose 3,5-epimerase